jgi:hypothetical protein
VNRAPSPLPGCRAHRGRPRVRVLDRDRRAMLAHDLVHDRQAQPAAVDLGAQGAVEGPEHVFALGRRDAGAVVLDLQHQHLAEGVGHQARGDGAAWRRVAQRVVDQVAHQFAQQHRVAAQARASGFGRVLVAQVDALFQGLRHEVAHHVHRGRSEVDLAPADGVFAVLGACHRQQLIDHVRRALARQRDLVQRVFHRLRFALAAVDLALGQLGLHAQPGQRCLQLVGGIGKELLLGGDRIVQAHQQVVDRAHQGHHLVGHVAFGDRAQVGALAAADALLQVRQRPDAARQREPHQHHRHRQDHELRQDHALDDLGGQLRTFVQRRGHLDQRRVLRLPAWAGQPQIGHAHRHAVHRLVAKAQRRVGLEGFGIGHRQVEVAAQELAAHAQHLVVDGVDIVAAQQRGGRVGQLDRDRRRPLQPHRRGDAHLARQ